jgi:Rrf2 family iron-sulfur cluster assembly transcriptional regulator
MKLTRAEEIALLLTVELTRTGGRTVSLTAISARHGVSVTFLKKIVRLLKQAGIVDSREGVGGGYTLADAAAGVTVQRVIAAVAPPLVPSDVRGVAERCPLLPTCLPETVRVAVSSAIGNALGAISVSSLAEGQGSL